MSFMLNQGLVGFGGGGGPPPIILPNLELHLDVGDADSWDDGVDSTRWRDLSGNSRDYFLGLLAAVDGDEPTFNAGGTVGGKSSNEYWTFPGGDETFKQEDSGTGTVLRTAGRTDSPFTVEVWPYFTNTTANRSIWQNSMVANSSDDGIRMDFAVNTDDRIAITIRDLNTRDTNDTNIGSGAWKQLVIAGKCDGTTSTFYVNGAADGTFSRNNTGFASGDSDVVPVISGRESDGALKFINGDRLAIIRIYSAHLSAADVLNNFEANRGRFRI